MLKRILKAIVELPSASLHRRINALEAQLDDLDLSFRLVSDQLDMFRSKSEISDVEIADFHQWKRENPLTGQEKVTVCVATKNRSQLLTSRCLPSILSQSYRELEVIVVGDHCTDDTHDRIAMLGDPRVTFVNLDDADPYPRKGLHRWMVAGSRALNHALDLASGELITHLDDDDEYLPGRIEKLLRFSVDHQCDLVWHPFYAQQADGSWDLNKARDFGFRQATTSSVFYRSWFKRIHWNLDAYKLHEPGDWNRFRRIKYFRGEWRRYPEPLLRHYKERTQMNSSTSH